jgi:zinc ribbon protein
MSPFRRKAGSRADGVPARRPHAGLLRREHKALLRAREDRLRDLGGLLVEMYRRGAFRDDLLQEGCADIVGIDARLADIDDLLHARRRAPRCECGAPILRGSHFCPNCGRPLAAASGNGASSAETVVAPPRTDDR